MAGLEIAGLALAGADVLLRTLHEFKRQYDSYKDLVVFLDDAERRVKDIRLMISKYGALESADASRIPGQVLERVKNEFGNIERSLNELAESLNSSNFKRVIRAQQSCETLKNVCTDLGKLERHLELYGLHVYGEEKLSAKIDKLMNILREKIIVPDEPKVNELLGRIRTNLPFCDEVPEHMRDTPYDDQLTHGQSNELFSKTPNYVRRLLESLSSSGIDENTRKQLTGMVRNLWCGWEVNIEDLFGLGVRKSIGQGANSSVYICELQRRDTLGKATGEKVKVAVKELKHIRKDEESDKQLSFFIRELFLQMDARHPCIVHVFGGFLSGHRSDFDDFRNESASPQTEDKEQCEEVGDDEDDDDEDDDKRSEFIIPYIVMERMSLNLREAMKWAGFEDWALRRRILKDVADGLDHLHGRGIAHRDVKPENVLLRRRKDTIVGHAKLGDFGVSRKTHDAGVKSACALSVTATGSLLYMPFEVLKNMNQCVSRKSWDVWSFGVLACEVGVPGCFDDILSKGSVLDLVKNGVLEGCLKKTASSIEDDIVRDVALCCLKLDRSTRPSMKAIAKKLSPQKGLEPTIHVASFNEEEPQSDSPGLGTNDEAALTESKTPLAEDRQDAGMTASMEVANQVAELDGSSKAEEKEKTLDKDEKDDAVMLGTSQEVDESSNTEGGDEKLQTKKNLQESGYAGRGRNSDRTLSRWLSRIRCPCVNNEPES